VKKQVENANKRIEIEIQKREDLQIEMDALKKKLNQD
jgi:hypothetical protein